MKPVEPVAPIAHVEVLPDAPRPIDAPVAPAVTIAGRSQMFTTKSGPGHVWFDIHNTGAVAAVELVGLAYVDGGIASPVDVRSIQLADIEVKTTTMTVAPGTHVLELLFDTSMIPRDRSAYLFRVTAKVGGVEVTGETTVRYARRIPIRP